MSVSTTSESEPLPGIERRQRSDAARNRERLLEAAAECFRENGLEIGVGEIAERAGVGRATLFRNFPTKADLVIAVVATEMANAVDEAEHRLNEAGSQPIVFEFVAEIVGHQQVNRSLFESVGEEAFMGSEEIQALHGRLETVLDGMIAHDQALGLVRQGVTAADVLMLTKGVCAVSAALAGDDTPDAAATERHLCLVHAAISAPGTEAPLTGCWPAFGPRPAKN